MGISPLPPHSPNVIPCVIVIRLVKDRIRDHNCATNETVREAASLMKLEIYSKGSFGFLKDGGCGDCGFFSEVNTVHKFD
jgi:hypothetical protein